MNWDHPTKFVQLAAALVAIPVALAGAVTFYNSQISTEGVCETLRSKVVAVIDRNVPSEVKYALVHRDVEQFEKKCAGIDPDTHSIFRVTIEHLQFPARAGAAPEPRTERQIRTAATPHATVGTSVASPVPHAQPTAIFGLSTAGERRGWVALSRRDAGHEGDTNFDGFADRQTAPPPAGTRLSARRTIPVWLEPQIPGPNDPTMMQGRLAHGVCVEVLATRAGLHRQWAQVTPVACP
jgi:hypothetical protein